MNIVLVPFGEVGPVLSSRAKADLILEELEDGTFRAVKNSLGFVADVVVTVWDEQSALEERINEIYAVAGVDATYTEESDV